MTKQIIILLFFLLSLGIHVQQLKIIVIGDMHGWVEPQMVDGKLLGGAAEMLAC